MKFEFKKKEKDFYWSPKNWAGFIKSPLVRLIFTVYGTGDWLKW
jgi:hypothetical protein